jgi:FkbM family methyltransferase
MPLHSQTKFVERVFNGRYPVRIPEWQRFPGLDYEHERTKSMADNLKTGDILLDIGASDGWLSAIYAQIVGAENLCIFEPSPDAWPSIKAIWDENCMPTPRFTYCGFVSDNTIIYPPSPDHDIRHRDGWPGPAYCDDLLEEMRFRSIKERSNDTPQITIDDFVRLTGIVPRGISIDVEGAEVLVLRGALKTLTAHRPLVWVSAHTVNGAIFYDYKNSLGDMFAAFPNYAFHWLEIAGDEHWFCVPN